MDEQRTEPLDPREQIAAELVFICKIAALLGVRSQDIKDVGHDVVVKALADFHKYDPKRQKLKVWLFLLTLRIVRNERRRSWRQVLGADEILGTATVPSRAEAHLAYMIGIAAISEENLPVFVWHDLIGVIVDDIADGLSLSVSKVKHRLSAARQEFRDAVDRDHRTKQHGMLLPLAALLELEQQRADSIAVQAYPRLRDAVRKVLDTSRRIGRDIGMSLGGAAAGGIIVFLLLSRAPERSAPATKIPAATVMASFNALIRTASAAPAVVPAFQMVPVDPMPADPPAPPPRDPNQQASFKQPRTARSLLEQALAAATRGDSPGAREAIRQYDKYYPKDPVPELRAELRSRLGH